MPTQQEIEEAAKKKEEDKKAAKEAAAAETLPGQNSKQPEEEQEEEQEQEPTVLPNKQKSPPKSSESSEPSAVSAESSKNAPQILSPQKFLANSTSPLKENSLTGPPPGSSKEPQGFFSKLFNVGNDGIMGIIKNLFQPKWLRKKQADPKSNKIVLGALLALNTVVAGLASAVLIGVGAVTAGILKGAYDVFDGISSIAAELIVSLTSTPPRRPEKKFILDALTTLGKGLAKFIVGSAIVAGIAMGGAGIAGVGAAAMLPVLTTIGKVISIGMLSLSSTAGLGLLTWVINKVAKRKQEEVNNKEKSEFTVNTVDKNKVPKLIGNSYFQRLKSFASKFSKSSEPSDEKNFSDVITNSHPTAKPSAEPAPAPAIESSRKITVSSPTPP